MASISDRVGDLGEYLREQREHARLSVRQLANLAGVSNPYLSQVERGLRKPSAEVLQAIARGLRISAEALYVRAGILDDEGRGDVEAAIMTDPELTERQRRVLLDIYASFRNQNRRGEEDGDAEGGGAPDAAAAGPPSTAPTTPAARARARVRTRPAGRRAAAATPAEDAATDAPPAPADPAPPAAEAVPAAEPDAVPDAAEPPAEPPAARPARRSAAARTTKRASRSAATSTRAARKAAATREPAPTDDDAGSGPAQPPTP